MSEIASAYISLLPSAKGYGAKLNGEIGGDVDKAGKTSGARFGKVFATASIKPFRAFGEAAVALFAVDKVKDFFASSIDEARESQKVSALTAQVIKSTGGAANISANQIGNLATAISNKVGVDDEAIQSGENMLLTFKNIRNEAGAGNKIFNQASRTMTDLAASMAAASGGQIDFKSSAIQLGKALNDPVKGITALSRVGVTFDAQQQKTIKSLVASGNTMGAQKIILKELKSEFGGAAAAQATAGEKMEVAWGNLKEQIGGALIPVLDKAESFMTGKAIPAVSNFITEMENGTGAGGDLVSTVKSLGSTVENRLLPPLETTVSIGKDVLGFVAGLPGPLKSIAVEGALAALVFPKINAGIASVSAFATGATARVAAFTGELKTMSFEANWNRGLKDLAAQGIISTENLNTTSRASEMLRSSLAKLGGAARQAGGVAGMLLLAQGTEHANSKLGAMETIAGGVATGFAVGGPWGAAIGGAGALALTLYQKIKQSNSALSLVQQATKDAQAGYDAIRDSLNKTTGAYTKNTAMAVANEKLTTASGKKFVATMQGYGLSAKEISKAAIGQKGALSDVNVVLGDIATKADKAKAANVQLKAEMAKVVQGKVPGADPAAIQEQINANQKVIDQGDALNAFWKGQQASLLGASADVREYNSHLAELSLVARGVPKTVAMNVTAAGTTHTIDEAKLIASLYQGLTKHDYELLLRSEGIKPTQQDIAAVAAAAKGLLPFKQMKIALSTPGMEASKKQIDAYAASAKLTPKQINTLYKIEGITAANTAINGVKANLASVNGKHATSYIDVFRRNLFGGKGPGHSAMGSTVPKDGGPYADRYPYLLAPGEEVISNKNGQADKWRWLLKLINAGRLSRGGTVGRLASGGTSSKPGSSSNSGSGAVGIKFLWQQLGHDAKQAATVSLKDFVDGLKGGTPQVEKQADLIAKMLSDKVANKKQAKKIKTALGNLTDAIKAGLDEALTAAQNGVDAAQNKVDSLKDTVSGLKDTLSGLASAVAQNYAASFDTNALTGPDGKLIAGSALSSFMDQLNAQGSLTDQVMGAYQKLLGEGLNGDWLQSLLASGDSNLVLDLASASKSQAMNAQSTYQQVQNEANALGAAVAKNTTTQSQLNTANKQLATATQQLAVAKSHLAAVQNEEAKLSSIDKQLNHLQKLDKLDNLPGDIAKGLNKLIARANKGRKS